MNSKCVLLLLLVLTTFAESSAQAQQRPFFRIQENEKVGFIDSLGNVIIQPIFRSAGDFTEGLAPARLHGTYGYIDQSGGFAIPTRYDFAASFSEGLALVYLKGRALFIDRKGQKVIDVGTMSPGNFKHGVAIVRTPSAKVGLIDRQGKLVVDTAFSSIGSFVEGLAVVRSLERPDSLVGAPWFKDRYTFAVIDTLGRFMIPLDKYEEIRSLSNGYFMVDNPPQPWDTIVGDTRRTGFLNRKGELVLSRDHSNNSWIAGNLSCGLARISLYKHWRDEDTGASFNSDFSYTGFINEREEMVMDDTTVVTATDFADNRAFIEKEDEGYFLIDTKGRLVTTQAYSNIIGSGFVNGLALVEFEGEFGVIDTTGAFVIKPQFEGVDHVGWVGDFFFFYEDKASGGKFEKRLFGMARRDGTIVLPPKMEGFDERGFQDGLLSCVMNGRAAYIRKDGMVVWQQSAEVPREPQLLNIDCMNRGYFYAYSKPPKAFTHSPWYESANFPKRIEKSDAYPKRTLSVVVLPEVTDSLMGVYAARKAMVVNTTGKRALFKAQDNRLYMKVQAKNEIGEWKDIEYLPNSWCGNSYHTVELQSKRCWTFLTPDYQGDFKTKLRIVLKYIDPSDKNRDEEERREWTIYSNEYEGGVNPGQFWRKQMYYPAGIMDPYVE